MKRTLAVLLILLLGFSALPLSAPAAEEFPTVRIGRQALRISPWAAEEVRRAEEYGLLPESALMDSYSGTEAVLLSDAREPVSRANFVRFALSYVAAMNHSGPSAFTNLVLKQRTEKNRIGQPVYPFTDDRTAEVTAAHALGLVEGRGGGVFDPDAGITREEAAALLLRAYAVCGGAGTEEQPAPFADEERISPWAREAVHTLQGWDVLRGMEDGSFDPKGSFTLQQCIVSFLRLYELAPVSRLRRNVSPVFTREEALAGLRDTGAFWEAELQVDGPLASFLRLSSVGVMQSGTRYYLVYADGGVRELPEALPSEGYGYPIENAAFSGKGEALSYEIRLEQDVTSKYAETLGEVLHEKGVYRVEIDVETGEQTVTKTG